MNNSIGGETESMINQQPVKDYEEQKETKQEEEDQVIKAIGGFGPWQIKWLALILLCKIPAAFPSLNITFLAENTDHWCKSPEMTLDQKWNNKNLDSCQVNVNESLLNCDAWTYERDESNNTIISEFNLVCERVWLLNLSKSILFFGFILGVISSGWAADQFGRKPVLQVLFLLMAFFGTVSAFMNSVELFITMRFFQGFFNIGVPVAVFCWVMEAVKGKWQTIMGLAFQGPWVIGWFLLALIAHLWPNWRTIQIITSVLALPSVFLLFWLPESPKWLLAVGKLKQAEKIVQQAATENGRILEKDWKLKAIRKDNESEKKGTLMDLFRTKNLATKTLILYLNWFANSFVYYGLSLNISSLTGSVMTDFLINGALEIPSYIIVGWILLYKGRKLPYTGLMLFGGLSLLATIAIPEPSAENNNHISHTRILLALTGKFCISATFAIMYIYSAEIYPTTVRGIGMGSSSVWARVGGIVAPYVGALGQTYGRAIPTSVFGASALVAGLVALFLPETQGRKLPDTVEECSAVPLSWKDGFVTDQKKNCHDTSAK